LEQPTTTSQDLTDPIRPVTETGSSDRRSSPERNMTGTDATTPAPGDAFRFRVSDSAVVPLRGHLLRLKLVEGSASMKQLAPGTSLTVMSPAGQSRQVTITAHSVMSGRARQARLDRTKELDVIISTGDASMDGRRIGIGWFVSPPAK
jgi:hypothetical protein